MARFWDCRRVVITGGAGFLGGYVVERLMNAGAYVWCPRSSDCDLTNPRAAGEMLSSIKPDMVIHLAARVGGIGANQKNPGRYLHDNAMMALNVFERCRLAGVKKLICVGTCCSYPLHAKLPLCEDDLWAGYPEETNAPYGIAKRLLPELSKAYRAQYGLSSIVLIPANLYGPRDSFDLETSHVIPAMIRKFCSGADTVTLWGNGTATREFLYADDCAAGILLAAERYDDSDPVNLGTGEEVSIGALAEIVADRAGFDGRIIWDRSRPNGQPRRCLDTTRARERFGFEAKTRLGEGLAATVAWYKANRQRIEAA